MPYGPTPSAPYSLPRAVCLDAGFTLLRPRSGVEAIYLEEARAVGAHPDPVAFGASLARCWRERARLSREDEGLRSSEELERAGWRRFTRTVAAPFPDLLERHATWLQRLFSRFDAPQTWEIMPGMDACIATLAARGLRLAVVSNWHGVLHDILAHLGLKEHVEFTLVSSEVGWRKPHPAMFQEALERLELAPEEVVHVGDSTAEDVEGAAGVGMRTVLFDVHGEGGNGVAAVRNAGDLRALLLKS